jgi:hypothetical protein
LHLVGYTWKYIDKSPSPISEVKKQWIYTFNAPYAFVALYNLAWSLAVLVFERDNTFFNIRQALHLHLIHTLTVWGRCVQHTSFTLWGFCDMLHSRLHNSRGFRFSHRRLWELWSTGVWSRVVTALTLYHQYNRSYRFLGNVDQFLLKLHGVTYKKTLIFTTLPVDKYRCEYLMLNKFFSTVKYT